MIEQAYIWQNGLFVEKEKAVTSVMTHALHYGTAVFEGIRAYKTVKGTAILKLKEHMQRFNYSMCALGMSSPYSIEEMCQAVIDTVRKNTYDACYIRPLAYYGEGGVGVLPKEDHPIEVIIACLPMGRYLTADSVDVLVSKYIRIHPDSTICDAKIAGHYVNSMLATMERRGTHYHEVLLLDVNGNVTEGAAQNIFIVKNNEIITTPLGTILNGITRRLVIQIARESGYTVHERYFKVNDIINAEEAFFSGTAAEIAPIRSVNDQKVGGTGEIGIVTTHIKKCFKEITQGLVESDALTYLTETVRLEHN
ncbi:branched-chain amino acid transaminase [Fastidiosibacter lacustris]|uniref:branched-chain amino acid transaminase n=1 Tax=Fastidiosibacter lacustris TaxID=2056695 RepID=UPI000E341D97|nr:branched-chain amino acid transaminase [Fastidiosibacter lacustris]